ncbi:MAG: hypothetical protein NC320_13165 [Clostridium sp.]|nr:hypothetical protein [Clostridium sp.]
MNKNENIIYDIYGKISADIEWNFSNSENVRHLEKIKDLISEVIGEINQIKYEPDIKYNSEKSDAHVRTIREPQEP